MEAETEMMLNLFHHRWSLPVISELQKLSGAKFVTLVNKLKISRDSLNRTLKKLIEEKWIERNPGYGHPMRPEYILSDSGTKLGSSCTAIVDEVERLDLSKIALNKWSLPILSSICERGQRFSDLKAQFPSITPRALTQSLKSLSERGLIERVVDTNQYPPLVEYKISTKSINLCGGLEELLKRLRELH